MFVTLTTLHGFWEALEARTRTNPSCLMRYVNGRMGCQSCFLPSSVIPNCFAQGAGPFIQEPKTNCRRQIISTIPEESLTMDHKTKQNASRKIYLWVERMKSLGNHSACIGWQIAMLTCSLCQTFKPTRQFFNMSLRIGVRKCNKTSQVRALKPPKAGDCSGTRCTSFLKEYPSQKESGPLARLILSTNNVIANIEQETMPLFPGSTILILLKSK